MRQQRIDKLRKILLEKNLEGFLVSNFYNILYLSEFKTLTENEREGWLLITDKNTYLFTDSRYVNSKFQITNDKSITNNKFLIFKLITSEKGLIKHLQEIVTEEKIINLGVEGDDLKVSEFNQFKKYLPDVNLISLEKTIIRIREIKDDDEIKNIKMACKITDKCLEEVVKTIKTGSSEKEIAFKIELWLKERNYDLAFYPIVAIDKNSSLPHYDTRNGDNKKVKNGSIILVDFGAKYHDYLSDITRMIFVGKPTNEMINIYRELLDAQEKTIQKLVMMRSHPNYYGKLIDQYCREQIITGYSYPHSTGHGVGLEIHEYPKISFTSEDLLLSNQVFTIEPGIYFKEKWGMRIEDTILIKEKGVEVLTRFGKQLLVI
jgi:Xaa-Pro aminopeptidase